MDSRAEWMLSPLSWGACPARRSFATGNLLLGNNTRRSWKERFKLKLRFLLHSNDSPNQISPYSKLSTYAAGLGTKLTRPQSGCGLPLATAGCAQKRTYPQRNPHPPDRRRSGRQDFFRVHKNGTAKPARRRRKSPHRTAPGSLLSLSLRRSCLFKSCRNKTSSATGCKT